MPEDYRRPDEDINKAHPLLAERLPILIARLRLEYGWEFDTIEIYRNELRQQWLYGAGRTTEQLLKLSIPGAFARPHEGRVTNASSARLSAHGCVRNEGGKILPAAAAVDIGPKGIDGRIFTRDDPWEAFVAAIARHGPEYGLVHFHSPGKAVWDKPHLQLVEWSDQVHRLVLKGVTA